MKKFIKVFGLILCFTFFGLTLVGCGKSVEEELSLNISEYREDFFYGSSLNMTATFTDGQRESDFVTDGKKSQLQDFGVLVVRSNSDLGDKPKFQLKINDEIYEGEMERNPFDGSYVVDVLKRVNCEDTIVVTMLDLNETITLECLSKDWGCDCNRALNVFIENNKDNLNEYMGANGFEGEVYIKIVADKKDIANIYWYVLCVCQDGNVFASLISVENGEIVQN